MDNGTTLNDRYVLQEQLGRGGQGVVWRAWDPRLGRDVAVKRVSLAEVGPDEMAEARTRLTREAQTMARVVHANVVQVFDSLEHEGEPWLVLEYVRARNLAEVLEQGGPLGPVDAARIGARIADGLAAAHAVGVEHRDVKPANVLITDRDQVKLTDFGIARAVGDSTLTRSGSLNATLPYLAVEVARGFGWTPAADVWALGATLYTMLEGSPPFGYDADDFRLLNKIMNGTVVPPRNAGPLTDTVMRLLAVDPAARPDAATAVRMLDDLAAGRAGAPAPQYTGGRAAGVPVGPQDRTFVPGASGGDATVRTWAGGGTGPGGTGPGGTDPRGGGPGVGGPPGGYPPGATPPPGRPPFWTRRKKVVAGILGALVVLAGATTAVLVTRPWESAQAAGPSVPAIPTVTRPLPLPADEQDADPCALLDPGPLGQFGAVDTKITGDTLDSCRVSIATTPAVSTTVYVQFGSRSTRPAEGPRDQYGTVGIVRDAPGAGVCQRTLVLPDSTPIYVQAFQSGGSPSLCTIADVTAASAVTILDRSGIVSDPNRLSNYVLRSVNACSIIDQATLAKVTRVDASVIYAGFGAWSCDIGRFVAGQPVVSTSVGVAANPAGGSYGRQVPVAGREVYVQNAGGSYNSTSCVATVVARRYQTTTGDPGAEVATISVDGPDRPDALCAQATALAAAAGPKLPAG